MRNNVCRGQSESTGTSAELQKGYFLQFRGYFFVNLWEHMDFYRANYGIIIVVRTIGLRC